MHDSKGIKDDLSVEKLRMWLTFISSLRWPVVLLIFLFVFKSQLVGFTTHVRDGEPETSWSEFPKAPAGYISAKIDDLAKEPDSQRRSELAEEIHAVASKLGSIHPRTLGILITGAGGSYFWNENSYAGQKKYFDQLESSGLAKVRTSRINKDFHVYLKYTPKGIELLRSVGFKESELEGITEP